MVHRGHGKGPRPSFDQQVPKKQARRILRSPRLVGGEGFSQSVDVCDLIQELAVAKSEGWKHKGPKPVRGVDGWQWLRLDRRDDQDAAWREFQVWTNTDRGVSSLRFKTKKRDHERDDGCCRTDDRNASHGQGDQPGAEI